MEIKVRISRESKSKCRIRDFNDILIVFSWKRTHAVACTRTHACMYIHHYTHGCYVTSTSSGNKWVQGLVPIGRHAAPFQIAFKAERSYNVFGDVAIDDIALTNCSLPPTQDRCSRNQFRCTRGSCVDLGRQCDFTDDCGDNTDELNCGQFNSR